MRIPSGELTPDAPAAGCMGCVAALFVFAAIVAAIVDAVTEPWQKATYTLSPSPRQIAGQLALEGGAQYSIDKEKVSIKLDKILSTAPYGHSGSLKLVFWADEEPFYKGRRMSGMQLASWDPDELKAGWFYHDIERVADLEGGKLVRGRLYFYALTLHEYNEGRGGISQRVTFKEPYIAPRKRFWNSWAAFGLISISCCLFFLSLYCFWRAGVLHFAAATRHDRDR
ncbi:MAG TPA: hypothetical protein VMM76_23090 [Pirellulaceae bacterium]|nr:hypothetical protein [Pirellulaceae bacterium]